MLIKTNFFVTYKGETKNISKDDFYKIPEAYTYYLIPYVSNYHSEKEIKANCFDTENELVEFIKFSYSDEKCTLYINDMGDIQYVTKNGRSFGRIGNTNLKHGAFPSWEDYRGKTKSKDNFVINKIIAVYRTDRYGNPTTKIYDSDKDGKIAEKLSDDLQTPKMIYPNSCISKENFYYSYLQTQQCLKQDIDFALKNPTSKINEPIFTNISKKYPKNNSL